MLHDILLVIVGILIGAAIGFFGARTFMKKYLKKNPPINENMIRAMFMQMGRKPSEAQIAYAKSLGIDIKGMSKKDLQRAIKNSISK